MKKFYPNLKFGFLIISFYLILLISLFIVCVKNEEVALWMKIGLIILFASGLPFFFVSLTSSAQINNGYLMYKETYFSKGKKFFLKMLKTLL